MAAGMIPQVVVSPLLGTVFNNLSSLIQSEFGLIWGVIKEMVKLSNRLSTIRNVIEDAEVKQITEKPIRNWLQRLKELAYDAEDLLDECVTEGLSPELETIGTNSGNKSQVTTNCFPSCFGFKENISTHHSLAKRIKELREQFDELEKEGSEFHLKRNVITTDFRYTQTSSFPVEQVYGRDKDREYLVRLLINSLGIDDNDDRQGRDVSVCAILGMAGLGKTTLAQMVHNDERIVNHFDVRCWVCVSENFDPKTLFKAMIESSGGRANDLENLDPIQRLLQERLSGKKFLLVLDDVWNEDQAKWDKLISPLKCGRRGSSIIVTTRLRTVATITGTLPIYYPKVLSEKDCWSLFRHRAFDMDSDKEIPLNIKMIGEEIVKKCGGIPLAAKALGGLLRFKREENEWLFVRESKIWDLPDDKEDAMLPAYLKLSYNHLPSHLRQCFAYCAIFPKDYVMEKDELIHLWMANGFIQSKGGSMELEDVGNEIFNDLLWRSLFQDLQKRDHDNVVGCKMHDLVHDLACSVMRNECSVMEIGKDVVNEVIVGGVSSNSISIRHLSLVYPNSSSSSSSSSILEFSLPKIPSKIRTLIQLNHPERGHVPLHLALSNCNCLRVLDLSQTNLRTVPTSIGNLKHLRYLDLSYNNFQSLFNESFCSLKNLQTLKLNGCHLLQLLPEDMRKMSIIKHMVIKRCDKLTQMPFRMGELICLQTLSIFVVGKEKGYGIEELQNLDHLRGELEIKGMEHVRSLTHARNSNLIRKKNLRILKLLWSDHSWKQHCNNTSKEDEEMLVMVEGLQPHPNIQKVHIKGYGGTKLPSWMGVFTFLPNLIEIHLIDCRRCVSLPSLGELPLLKVLIIGGMDSLKCIGLEFYKGDYHLQQYFPSLEQLDIFGTINLEEWSSPSQSSSSNGDNRRGEKVLVFPVLKQLVLESCPILRRCPQLPPTLQHLKLRGSNKLILVRLMESLPPCLSTLFISSFPEVVSLDGIMMSKLRNLNSLKTLEISSCSKLKTLPKELIGNLRGLVNLKFWACEELVCLPQEMRNLTSLVNFDIALCHAIISLPEMGATTLVHLRIDHCFRLASLSVGLRHLKNLETFYIDNCPELQFFPDDFQHLISLQYLTLSRLPKMISLPIIGSQDAQHPTTTLECLKIISCPGMTTLPGWITNFTSLQVLEILDCENLKLSAEQVQWYTTLETPDSKTRTTEFVMI